MPQGGFEPTISAGERPNTYALDRAATGTDVSAWLKIEILNQHNQLPHQSNKPGTVKSQNSKLQKTVTAGWDLFL